MKKQILYIFFSILYLGTFAQDSDTNLDSLLLAKNNKLSAIERTNLYNQIASQFWQLENKTGYDSAIKYNSQAIDLARKNEYNNGLAEGLYNLGKYYLALDNGLATSTPYFLESLAVYEEENDTAGISKCYLQLGVISYVLEYYEDAIKNFKRAKKNYYNPTANYLLGLSYMEVDSFDLAKKNLLISKKDFEKLNAISRIEESNMYLGNLYCKINQLDTAFYYLNMVINSLIARGDSESLSRPYAFISEVYYKKKEFAKAKKFADLSYKMTQVKYDPVSSKKALEVLSNVHAELGDFKKAYTFLIALKQKRDSFFNGSVKQKIADMQSLFDFKRKIKDQKLLRSKDKQIAQQQIQKEKVMRNGLLVSAALLLMLVFGLYKRYSFKQKANLKLEAKNKIIIKEKERSDELLLNILPEEVAEELKLNGRAEAKFFEQATVMFTDFKDFTKIAEKLTPAELVAEIDTCFRAFDGIITKHNIEKIKTIGDAYMCVGGLPVANNTHAFDITSAAIEIRDFISKYIQQRISEGKEPFEIRIGIHTGSLVAGIVGSTKFAYDIWGDSVNIASRMETSSVPGKINISGDTYALVKDQFNCTYRGKVQAKHKGEIDMYFVENII